MRKTPEQVKKLIEAYLTVDCVHKYPIVEITHRELKPSNRAWANSIGRAAAAKN